MSEPSEPTTAPSPLRPTWGRLLFAAALAAGAFFLPQEVPLEWYPLNEPGTDINYLEITCASDKTGDVQIFYNLSTGIQQLNSIYFPISPTEQTFTYTFPLPDGPITELRIDPVAQGGALTIRQMRIINRRNEEIRRFTKDDFIPVQQIAGIVPLADGWKIISAPGTIDPYARIEMPAPIIPVGKDHRNLLRCLLSTGYLAGMLFILLLAVLTATYHPRDWRDFLLHAGFMATLALLFAPVGNRGLIRNSIHYARFVAPAVAPGATLEVDLATDRPLTAQLFWDLGRAFNEADSARCGYENHPGLQILRFPLPAAPLRALRFDPLDGEARLVIRGLRVVDAARRTLAVLPVTSLTAAQDIARHQTTDGVMTVETAPGRKDPILVLDAAAVESVNRILAGQRK